MDKRELLKAWIGTRQDVLIARIGDLVRALPCTGRYDAPTGAWADDGPEDIDDTARYSLDCGVMFGGKMVRFRIIVETVVPDGVTFTEAADDASR
jgi:hypothetical protein